MLLILLESLTDFPDGAFFTMRFPADLTCDSLIGGPSEGASVNVYIKHIKV